MDFESYKDLEPFPLKTVITTLIVFVLIVVFTFFIGNAVEQKRVKKEEERRARIERLERRNAEIKREMKRLEEKAIFELKTYVFSLP